MAGKLFLILGPSGSGKGTVLSYLREKHPDFFFPVSYTTRKMRPGEVAGNVYNFISKSEFERKKEAGDFLEWAQVHKQNYYGTLKKPILEALADGKVVVREVDVQGLKSIRSIVKPSVLTSIFLMVKDWETLRMRILSRSDMSEQELNERRNSYEVEKKWSGECDFVVESISDRIDFVCENVENTILSRLNG